MHLIQVCPQGSIHYSGSDVSKKIKLELAWLCQVFFWLWLCKLSRLERVKMGLEREGSQTLLPNPSPISVGFKSPQQKRLSQNYTRNATS